MAIFDFRVMHDNNDFSLQILISANAGDEFPFALSPDLQYNK